MEFFNTIDPEQSFALSVMVLNSGHSTPELKAMQRQCAANYARAQPNAAIRPD